MSKLLVANWKMHQSIAETKAFVATIQTKTWLNNHQVVICGPYTVLATLQQLLPNHLVQYGAQNMHWSDSGAFTGEISPVMLVELGCRYVIIGHSERRRDNNETNATVNKKVLSALRHNLTPIICVGESLEQRQLNQTAVVITEQVNTALANITQTDLNRIVIAYEPIWAIGTGQTATPEQAQQVHALIRSLVTPATPIIYGGSVNADNTAALMAQPDINGALIGGASLKVESFLKILNYTSSV